MVFVMAMLQDRAGEMNVPPPNSSRPPRGPVHGLRGLRKIKLWAQGLSRSTVLTAPMSGPQPC